MPRPIESIELMNSATEAFDAGNYQEALNTYEKLLGIDANDEAARFYKGVTFYELKEYKAAQNILEQIDTHSLLYSLSLYYASLAHKEMQEKVQAMAKISEAIALSPENSFLYIARAKLYDEIEGSEKQARKDYATAQRIRLEQEANISGQVFFSLPPPQGCVPIPIKLSASNFKSSKSFDEIKYALRAQFESYGFQIYPAHPIKGFGYAFITGLEQYNPNGLQRSGPNEKYPGNIFQNIIEYFKKLVFPQVGYYRVFVVLLTNNEGLYPSMVDDMQRIVERENNRIIGNDTLGAVIKDIKTNMNTTFYCLTYAYSVPESNKEPDLITLDKFETTKHLRLGKIFDIIQNKTP